MIGLRRGLARVVSGMVVEDQASETCRLQKMELSHEDIGMGQVHR